MKLNFSLIISILFLVNYYFLLIPKDTFDNNSDLLTKRIEDFESYNYNLVIFNSICYLAIIALFLKHEKIKKDLLLISYAVLFLSYTLSISINQILGSNFQIGFSLLSTPISYFALFIASSYYKIDNKVRIAMIASVAYWSIAPLLLFAYNPSDGLYKFFTYYGGDTTTTFKGYALHRNEYGFYAGLSALLIFFTTINNKLKLLLIITIVIGIILSESRSTLLATCLSFFYFLYKSNATSKNKLMFFFIIITIIFFSFQFYDNYSVRGHDQLLDYSDRSIIFNEYIDSIRDNFLLGVGYYFVDNNGDVAHNFIIQTLASYGFLVSIAFIIFIFFIWKNTNTYFKTIFLYLLIIGLFQPYFNLTSINNMTLIALIFAISFNNEKFTKHQ